MVAYVAALAAGATVTASVVYGVGRYVVHPSPRVVGLVALVTVLGGTGLIPIPLPESKWAVPRSWRRFGHVLYAAIFGGILGLGFVTAVASLALYTIVAWGLTVAIWLPLWIVLLMFAVARSVPLLVVAARAHLGDGYLLKLLCSLQRVASRTFFLELGLLGMTAAVFLSV
mgnify:CR=1 FL=1